jgi:hypothetical protein
MESNYNENHADNFKIFSLKQENAFKEPPSTKLKIDSDRSNK